MALVELVRIGEGTSVVSWVWMFSRAEERVCSMREAFAQLIWGCKVFLENEGDGESGGLVDGGVKTIE